MSKPLLTALVVLAGLIAALVPVQEASAAARATSVNLRSAPSGTVGTGSTLVIAGKVVGGVKGVKVSLQRRTSTGWSTEATQRIPSKLTFRFSWSARKGKQTYRVAAARTTRTKASVSPSVTVTGVTATQPSFNVAELPGGYEGVLYRFDGFGAKSGWDYSVVSGALPDGLTLTEAPDEGYIDGTPTTPGTYDFTLRITAPGATAVTRAFTIVVRPTGSWQTTDDRIAAVSNDGTRAVQGGTAYAFSESTAAYLDLSAGTSTPIPLPVVADDADPDAVFLAPLDLSGNGRYVLLQYAAQYYSSGLTYFWMYRWDSATGDFVQVAPAQGMNPFEGSLSQDGSVAAWSVNFDIEVWTSASGTSTPVADVPGGTDFYPVAESLSDDGRYLLVSNYPGLYLLDRQQGTHQTVDSGAGYGADLSRDGSTVLYNDLVQTSPDRFVLKTWDRASGAATVVSRLANGTSVLNSTQYPASISGDGEQVFFSSDRSVGPDGPDDSASDYMRPYVWDSATQQVVPLPMIPGTSDLPDAREISWTEPSYDGSLVAGSLWEKYGNLGYSLFSLSSAWTV